MEDTALKSLLRHGIGHQDPICSRYWIQGRQNGSQPHTADFLSAPSVLILVKYFCFLLSEIIWLSYHFTLPQNFASSFHWLRNGHLLGFLRGLVKMEVGLRIAVQKEHSVGFILLKSVYWNNHCVVSSNEISTWASENIDCTHLMECSLCPNVWREQFEFPSLPSPLPASRWIFGEVKGQEDGKSGIKWTQMWSYLEGKFWPPLDWHAEFPFTWNCFYFKGICNLQISTKGNLTSTSSYRFSFPGTQCL